MIRRLPLLLLVLCLGMPSLSSAQDDCLNTDTVTFDTWLNCRVGLVIAMAAGPQGQEKQAESPSLAETSSTLVDTSSAPDFVGFGLTLFGFRNPSTGSSEATPGVTSITASAYSLLAAAYGRDPLADRDFYYRHRNWRRVSFTIGRQPARDDGLGLNSEATSVGVKFLFLNLREIARDEQLMEIQAAVNAANLQYANISRAVQEALLAALAPGSSFDSFLNDISQGSVFETMMAKLDGNAAKAIDAAILGRIQAEVAMRDVIAAKIDEIKRRPQISMAWSSNLRDATTPDQHRFEGIMDYRMAPRLEFTANVGIDIVDAKGLVLPVGADSSTGRGAAAFKLLLADPGPGLSPKEPVALVFSGDLQRKASDTSFRAQVKLTVPLARGLSVPISATWADSPSRIDEKEVRGTFGFTIDTSKLVAGLR